MVVTRAFEPPKEAAGSVAVGSLAAVKRQINDPSLIDDFRHGCVLGLNHRSVSCNLDGLRRIAQSERDIDCNLIANFEGNSGIYQALKTFAADLKRVPSDRKIGKDVGPSGGARCRPGPGRCPFVSP